MKKKKPNTIQSWTEIISKLNANKTSPFAPHGEQSRWWESDIIYHEYTGPFNKEFFVHLTEIRDEVIKTVEIPKIFGAITTFKKDVQMGPDALKVYSQYMKDSISSCAAFVIKDDEVIAANLMKPILQKVWAESSKPIAIFDNQKDARVWVRKELDKIKQPS
jgi:hypothetical protein